MTCDREDSSVNVKQKQCLLEYLGYYDTDNSNKVNNVDGIWGPVSKAATEKFQSDYGLVSDGIFGPLTQKVILDVVATGRKPGINWDKIKYFGRAEFMCNCGGKYCNGFPTEPAPLLVATADKVRGHFGRAVFISSGVRCKQHNKNVGGVADSRHLTGRAMDFRVDGNTAREVLSYVADLPQVRYAYAIDQNYVHMDVK